MTDLVVAVRLKADGSGLVGQAREASAAIDGVGAAAKGAAADAKTLGVGTAAAGAAARALADDQRQAAAALDAAASKASRSLAANLSLEGATLRASIASDRHAAALKRVGDAAAEDAEEQQRAASQLTIAQARLASANAAVLRAQDSVLRSTREKVIVDRQAGDELNRNAFGARNLGQQFGDLGLSIAGGISPARAFGQQAGQIGYALSEMSGTAGKVGAFLTGPWGIALTIGAAVVAPLVEELFQAKKGAEEVEVASSNLGEAQSLMADLFGKASSKIAEQNALLLVNARIKAGNLRAESVEQAETARAAFSKAGTSLVPGGLVSGAAGLVGLYNLATGNRAATNPAVAGLAARARAASQLGDPDAARIAFDGILKDTRNTDFEGSSIDRKSFAEAVSKALASRANARIADLIDSSLDNGAIDPLLAKPGRTAKPKKPASTAARDEFGRDAADRLAGITAQFDATPPALLKTNAEVRKLDDLIDDLSRKKPPDFEALIASAEAAKATVRARLIDGVAEAFDRPRTLGEQAAVAMRQLDAIAADLETRKPPNFEALLGDVERARTAIRDGLARPFDEFVEAQAQSFQIGQLIAAGRVAEANALRDIAQLERQMGPLTADQRAAVLATNEALFAQERQIERLHRRQQIYLDAIADVQGLLRQTIYEGPDGIKELPKRLGEAVRRFSTEKLVEGLFGEAFDKLRDQVTGADRVENAADRMADAVAEVASHTASTTTALDGLAASANGAARAVAAREAAGSSGFGLTRDATGGITSDLLAGVGDLGQAAAALGEIVVTAKRLPKQSVDPFAGSIGQIVSVLGRKVGIDDLRAEKLGQAIGGFASKGLKGAVEGQAAASVAGLLGIKTSSTGASLGGAVGGLLPIPGGSIVGGLAGGIIGGLFGSTKKASSTIGASNGEAIVTGTTGNSAGYRKEASGLAGSVASSLQDIVDRLGGELGDFSVSIGQRKKKYVVDPTGSGRTKGGATQSFDTAEEAAAAALANAIADGAVKGISPAMQRALQSSPDVDKAVAEALKVQKLETLIGGVAGQLGAAFKAFDAEAAERVRLARKYGLDLLQVEKINGEERAKLLDDTLRARVGSLRDLLSDLDYGDLFAGDAADRRDAILKEIADAKSDQEAGVGGAGDRLADLYRRLLQTTEEGFGTAGPELAADREAARAGAEQAIRVEEERVKAAAAGQAATTKAVESVAQLADEGNDLLASINSGIQTLIGQTAIGHTVDVDLSLVRVR